MMCCDSSNPHNANLDLHQTFPNKKPCQSHFEQRGLVHNRRSTGNPALTDNEEQSSTRQNHYHGAGPRREPSCSNDDNDNQQAAVDYRWVNLLAFIVNIVVMYGVGVVGQEGLTLLKD
jgi:hypothetical protein